MSKNILEFCLSPDLGGLELFMASCFEDFTHKTNTYAIVTPNSKLDLYLAQKVSLYIKRNKFFPLFPALKLAKFIDEKNIDIIHFHWTKDINVVVLAKLLSKKKPQIVQTRNMTMTRFKDDFYHRWLYKNISMMHAVTYQVKAQLEKFIPSDIRPQIQMVYMGCEASNVNPIRIEELRQTYNLQGSFVVGIVGRIEEGKGQYLVIEAIAKLNNPYIKGVIVGHTMDEHYLHQLKQKALALGVDQQIVFTGFTKEVNEHMRLFDVNVLATPKETFGLVVIEAMANKICMIATNKAGPLEIINDGVDGLLFERNSDDLASKIKMLYDDKDLKLKLADAGQQKAEKEFDKTTQLNKLYHILEQYND